MTTPDSALATGFLQATYSTKGPRTRGPVLMLVVHATASPDRTGAAHATAKWFARPDTRRASAHFSVDDQEIWQSVREDDVAWGAAGANARAIHIEHVGLASQTSQQWDDDYSRAELELSAHLAADICRRHRIPTVWLSVADLQAGRAGITTHATVSAAFPKVSTGHTDPGLGFPKVDWLADVQRILAKTGPPVAPVTPPALPWLRYGSQGPAVERLQRILRLRPNGAFGKATRAAVEAFQRRHGLDVDGIVGPLTWAALGVTR